MESVSIRRSVWKTCRGDDERLAQDDDGARYGQWHGRISSPRDEIGHAACGD
jgi:hypothetical protein